MFGRDCANQAFFWYDNYKYLLKDLFQHDAALFASIDM